MSFKSTTPIFSNFYALLKGPTVIPTEAPVLAFARKHRGRSGEIYSKTDFPSGLSASLRVSTRLQLARNDILNSFQQSKTFNL